MFKTKEELINENCKQQRTIEKVINMKNFDFSVDEQTDWVNYVKAHNEEHVKFINQTYTQYKMFFVFGIIIVILTLGIFMLSLVYS